MKRLILSVFLSLFLCFSLEALSDKASFGYTTGDQLGAASRRKEAVVVSKNVTLRSKASSGSTGLGSASNGDILTVLDDSGGSWVYVRAHIKEKQIDGWVQRSYIVLQPLSLILRRSNTPAYCAPDSHSKLVGSLPAYTKLDVLGTYDDYYIVSLRQAAAFISMEAQLWTSSDIDALFAKGSGTAITLKKAKTRSGPGESWPEGKSVPKGEELKISWEQDGWIPVLYEDTLYYIKAQDLKITSQVRGRQQHNSDSTSQPGQTITLPSSDGVVLVYWAQPESFISGKPAPGTLTLTQAAEKAVQAICKDYNLRRKVLKGCDLRYSYYSSAWYAYGVSHPFWVIYLRSGDEAGTEWVVSVDAQNGRILEISDSDNSNG